jgi:hypothetical protein
MYTDFYIHSLKKESSFDDVITLIASSITTHEQVEKVSQKVKFNCILHTHTHTHAHTHSIIKLNGGYEVY